MKKIDQKTLHRGVRYGIQIGFFFAMPSAFTAAFAGMKYLFTQIGNREMIEWTSFVAVLVALCGYTIVFGRFFCGFACAFGSMGEWLHNGYVYLCKKRKKKKWSMPEQLRNRMLGIKYIIVVGILLMSYLGLMQSVQGTSPWDVFSMVQAGNFRLAGYMVGVILLVLILVGMFFEERFFCKFLCPMSAIFAMLPILPFFTLKRTRQECIKGCRACNRTCFAGVELPEDGSIEVSGECFQCQKCVSVCPKKHIHCGVSKWKGNELWFNLLRAGILLALLFLTNG